MACKELIAHVHPVADLKWNHELPWNRLTKKGTTYLPVKQSQEVTQGPLYLCLPFTSSVMASTGW